MRFQQISHPWPRDTHIVWQDSLLLWHTRQTLTRFALDASLRNRNPHIVCQDCLKRDTSAGLKGISFVQKCLTEETFKSILPTLDRAIYRSQQQRHVDQLRAPHQPVPAAGLAREELQAGQHGARHQGAVAQPPQGGAAPQGKFFPSAASKFSTGWHIRLFSRFSWHQCKSCS